MLPPVEKITPPEWMKAPQTRAVMDALAEGAEPKALFVGGCVRNTVLGQPEGDIDIATVWTPEQVKEKLQAAAIRTVPTGIEYGTITAVVMGSHFEITTLRRDVETDGRRAVVAFTEDWGVDAQRRDFTMNTLLADEAGNIYDPAGRGLGDLRAGRVVFVGDPAERIAEDYLRILRFFRFHARFGQGEPDKAALKACRAAAGKIGRLSRERITQEFLQILALENPVKILALMFENKVLADLAAKDYDPGFMATLCALQRRYGLPDVAARLLALMGLNMRNIGATEQYLVLTNNHKKTLASIAQALQETGVVTEASARTLIYKYGPQYALQALLIAIARDNPQDDIIMPMVRDWQPPIFPLTGDDAIALGVSSGVEIGRLLRVVKNWWLEEDFRPDRKACLKQLEEALRA